MAGHCCWPGQDWGASSKKCIGEPRCPDGFVPTGGGCKAGCAAGKKRVSGHCCWPGQDWGASGKKCLGKPRCPAGMALTPDKQACVADPGIIHWVRFPASSFEMGVKDNKWTGPQRTVKLSSFSLGKTEVTVAQYARCVKKKACAVPLGGRTHCTWGKEGRERFPVSCVSWKQASTFCAWAGGRLPTEAEWEYAARGGGKKQRYPWGDDSPHCGRVVMGGSAANCANKKIPKGPAPVCSRPTGNTAQGLCDMAGNVYEWVQDWHARPYSALDTDNPRGPASGKSRVARGSDWCNGAPRYFEVTYRKSIYPGHRWDWLGFRCVKGGK